MIFPGFIVLLFFLKVCTWWMMVNRCYQVLTTFNSHSVFSRVRVQVQLKKCPRKLLPPPIQQFQINLHPVLWHLPGISVKGKMQRDVMQIKWQSPWQVSTPGLAWSLECCRSAPPFTCQPQGCAFKPRRQLEAQRAYGQATTSSAREAASTYRFLTSSHKPREPPCTSPYLILSTCSISEI